MVESYLEKIFNIQKKKEKQKIIYIVKDASMYEHDALVLRKLGHTIEIQEREKNLIEQLRRADVLADYVYVEEDLCVENVIRFSKRLNNCRNLGLLNFLNFKDISLYKKNVLVYGDNIDLIGKLIAAGAIVTVSTNKDLESRNFDLIINLKREKPLNCYPIHCLVLDIAKNAINIENRNVITDCHWFNILGVLEQLW